MTLGYPRNDMVLGFESAQVRVRVRQQQYGMGSNSMSAFSLFLQLIATAANQH